MQSLETHLFFGRIMKEHALFLQLGFTPRDTSFTNRANQLRMEFDNFLWDVAELSNGNISRSVIESNEIVTSFTLRAENKSSFYTGINIPSEITKAELKLEAENVEGLILDLNKPYISLTKEEYA